MQVKPASVALVQMAPHWSGWNSGGSTRSSTPFAVPNPWTRAPYRNTSSPTGSSNGAVHGNTETHWWDGSQIYGSDQATQDRLRSGDGGKLRLTTDATNALRFRERNGAGMLSVNNSTSGAEAPLPFGGNGKSGNGSRLSGIWVLDQFTRWQSMNWDYAGKLQKAQMDIADLPADLDYTLPEEDKGV